jgi:hypothetical protein
MRTGCGPAANDAVTCLCGDASSAQCIVSPTGPCATEELAALQYRPDSIEKALTNYYDITPQFAGVCGGSLNYVFQQGIGLGCFQNLDAGAHTPRRGR